VCIFEQRFHGCLPFGSNLLTRFLDDHPMRDNWYGEIQR
jgi:hypothetical protein